MEEGYSWGAREVDNRGERTELRVGGLLFLPEQSTTLYLICGSLYPAEKLVPGKAWAFNYMYYFRFMGLPSASLAGPKDFPRLHLGSIMGVRNMVTECPIG